MGEDLTLRERKTRFIEILRTTPPKTVCPNFYILAHANGCAFRPQCEYCYLKASLWYLKDAHLFTNVSAMLDEARAWIALDDLESYVLNTGNLSDSLAFEDTRPLIADLVEIFRHAEEAGRPHTFLLVTKGGTAECQPLFAIEPCANVIVSFSVNSAEAAKRYEKGAATVADRMSAAARLKHLGWRVRMRFDPMIAGFDYSEVIEDVKRLAPERITLGTLRAEPKLLRTVDHGMFDGLVRPDDPKGIARYPLPVRLRLYGQAVEAFAGQCPVSLCEETEDVWKALGLDSEAKLCNCAL